MCTVRVIQVHVHVQEKRVVSVAHTCQKIALEVFFFPQQFFILGRQEKYTSIQISQRIIIAYNATALVVSGEVIILLPMKSTSATSILPGVAMTCGAESINKYTRLLARLMFLPLAQRLFSALGLVLSR